VFIGGSTSWKCSVHVERIIKTAKLFEKRVHAGRVNTPERFKHFEKLGADSCDGNGIGRYTHMREAVADRHIQQELIP
jgi:EAL domain-containing protein (putative c-di-GMP-specific phosphodiesterase class I)